MPIKFIFTLPFDGMIEITRKGHKAKAGDYVVVHGKYAGGKIFSYEGQVIEVQDTEKRNGVYTPCGTSLAVRYIDGNKPRMHPISEKDAVFLSKDWKKISTSETWDVTI